jgi:Zn-dependent protease with chaperone function
MYKLLGICLALGTLFALNVFASLLLSVAWRIAEPATRRWSARTRAEILFTLRISPALVSFLVVAMLLVPAYINYEPHATREVVSTKLGTLAALSIIGLSFAVWRAVRSWTATKRLERTWLRAASRISLPLIDVPTFRIAHSFPIIAVVGTFRPRLFIADQVLQSLNSEELAAAIAHESGHLAAGDNLKRALLRACRDLLTIVPSGRLLDRAWSESVESAADEHAAQLSPDVALNLASALVRIVRMVPIGVRTELPIAAFLVGDETRGIKARVRRLLEIASTTQSESVREFRFSAMFPAIAMLVTILVGTSVVSNTHVLLTVHSLVERVVSFLS